MHSSSPTPPTIPVAASRHDRSLLWAPAMLVAYCVVVLPSLGQSLLESHAHRQTQTAYTALLYAQDRIDLLRPPLPVLGPPGSIPQELPLFQAAGALVMRLALPPDLAMRIVGLTSFLGAAWFVYILARRLMGSLGSLVALGAFLFNSIAWVYGRSSLIEYLAVAGGVGFLYLASRWMDEGRAWQWAGAAGIGLVGILVKITTGGFLLVPALLWRSASGRWGFQRASVWALVGISVAVGLAWSAYAQGVREETPASAFLSMPNQLAWFFGTLWQRFDLSAWRVPFVALLALTGFGLLVWGPLAVICARQHPQAAFLLGLLGLVALMPLVLFNLYAIHDYYWIAVAPMIAIGVGMVGEWLWSLRRRRWPRRAMVALAGAWVATIIGMAPTWTIIYGEPAEEEQAMRIASFVREHSDPDDWVVLRGLGWNSTYFYYAQRQGLAVPEPEPNLVAGRFGLQDLANIDFDTILANPVLGPFIRCDRDAACTIEDGP